MATLREQLEASFEEHENPNTDPPSTEQEDHERGSTQETRDEQATDDAIEQEVRTEQSVEKPRDSTGKFVKGDSKQPNADKVPADGQQAAKSVQVKQEASAPAARAPVSWRPDLREHFSKLAPEIQAEINRRETEIGTALRESADARQFAQSMYRTIQPFEAMIRAEGGNPIAAVDSLLKTAYHLRTAHPQQKAQMVAQMIQQHGVDVDMLDQALAGLFKGQPNPQVSGQMNWLQQELAPIKNFIGQLQSRQTQMTQNDAHSAQQELEAFLADPKNEFAQDVMHDMADYLDVASKNGRKMALSEAYQRAIVAHPTISKVLEGRKTSAGVAQRTAAARRAQNASASLPSGGAPAGAAGNSQQRPRNIRSAVEAAWDEVAERET
jgi:hypothetical protein